MKTSSLPLAALMLAAACAPAAETADQTNTRIAAESSALKMTLDSLNTAFDAAFNAGQGDAVAAQYTEDGELMVAGSPAATGRAAIAAFVNALPAMKASIRTKAVAVMANGPLGIERGEYTMTVVPPGAPGPITDVGTYLIHWHRVDGHWLRVSDVATTPTPPQPAGPPPRS
jgi:uncharacterized protein (TIGR02246 family)